MAQYRLTQAAFLRLPGHLSPQYCTAGEIIQFDGVPAQSMFPMDADAVAAVAARRAVQPFEIARNGVQAIDSRAGRARRAVFVPHGPSVMK